MGNREPGKQNVDANNVKEMSHQPTLTMSALPTSKWKWKWQQNLNLQTKSAQTQKQMPIMSQKCLTSRPRRWIKVLNRWSHRWYLLPLLLRKILDLRSKAFDFCIPLWMVSNVEKINEDNIDVGFLPLFNDKKSLIGDTLMIEVPISRVHHFKLAALCSCINFHRKLSPPCGQSVLRPSKQPARQYWLIPRRSS